MRLLSKEGAVFRIIAYPDERVSKGEYLAIEDDKKNLAVLVQVADIDYADVPGLLEELIREGLYESERVVDPQNLGRTTRLLRDVKLLTCVSRGVIRDTQLSTRVDDLPSRACSGIRVVSSADVLKMASPTPSRIVHLGRDSSGKQVAISAERFDGRLTLITGMKGTGKSHLSKLLVKELAANGAPVLVIDLNGEYVGLGRRKDGSPSNDCDRVKVYHPGLNLSFTPKYLGLRTVLDLLVNVLHLPGVSSSVFKQLWRLTEAKDVPSLTRLERLASHSVSNMLVKDAIVSRLMSLGSCPFITDDKSYSTTVESLVRPGQVSVLVIRDLSSVGKKLLVEVILSKLVSLAERRHIPPLFLFAEEAHTYIRDTYWGDLTTRMRHFGLFVIFVTNQPDALDHRVFRQLDNIFLFCFKNERDLEMVSSISDIDGTTVKSIARELPTGSCLAIGWVVSSLPILVHVSDLDVDVMGDTRRVFQDVLVASLASH